MGASDHDRPETPPSGVLRRMGIGVALAELLFLLGWIALTLAAITSSPHPDPILAIGAFGSMPTLARGMAWAAAIGMAGGLTALCATGIPRTGHRPTRGADQALARALVVRNHTR
jgi:hypothetical protein